MGILGLVLTVVLFIMVLGKVPGALRDYRRGDWLAGMAASGIVGLTIRGLFERSSTLGLGNVNDSLIFFLFVLILLGRNRWGRTNTIKAAPPVPPPK